jgi:hypothetical protein
MTVTHYTRHCNVNSKNKQYALLYLRTNLNITKVAKK